MRQLNIGETIAGRYRLTHLLAQGGMGTVWSAWNAQLDVPVAIKFMTGEAMSSPELVARFEREARSAAQLRSPHVVHIYEHGVFDGVPFMVMELLEGEDLGKRLKARGRLPLGETARILGDVCKALRKAHELSIVHRDLKPANIFLSGGDEDGEIVKVLDFGIAKLLATSSSGEVTKSGALIGTPNYMSPEQARRTNHQVDHRTDLWALGVIAFRALTGKLPYPGDDPIDVLVRICTQAPPPPSSVAPDLGPAIDAFFSRALAFDPDHRFRSARDFAEALHALAGRPAAEANPPRQSWFGEPHAAGPAASAAAPAPAPIAAKPPAPFGRPSTDPSPAGNARLLGAQPMDSGDMQAANAAYRAKFDSSAEPITLMPDATDVAQTMPLRRSPAAQALLRAAQVGQDAAANVAPTPPKSTPAVPSFAVSTLPLGMPAAAIQAEGSRKSQPEVWPEQPQRPDPPQPHAAMTALSPAGESAGTITSAVGELPVRTRRQPPYVILAAIMAAIFTVVLVASVIGAAVLSGSDSADPAASIAQPRPSATSAPVESAPSPTPAVTASAPSSASAIPSATLSASAAATAPSSASAIPSATLSASAAATAKPKGSAGSGAIFGPPKF